MAVRSAKLQSQPWSRTKTEAVYLYNDEPHAALVNYSLYSSWLGESRNNSIDQVSASSFIAPSISEVAQWLISLMH